MREQVAVLKRRLEQIRNEQRRLKRHVQFQKVCCFSLQIPVASSLEFIYKKIVCNHLNDNFTNVLAEKAASLFRRS